MEYPKDMDTAMIPLCDALNAIDGIETCYCCEGHGESEFYVSAVIHKGNSFADALDAYRAIFPMLPSDNFPFRFDIELTYALPPRSPEPELKFVARCPKLGCQLDENIRYAAIRTLTDRALAFGKKEVRA